MLSKISVMPSTTFNKGDCHSYFDMLPAFLRILSTTGKTKYFDATTVKFP